MQGTFGGFPLLDPIQEKLNWQKAEQKWPLPEEFKYANCLLVPLGSHARGWLLLSRDSLNRLNLNAVQALTLTDDYGKTLTFNGLVYVTARCVSPGKDQDPAAAYLVEVADGTWLAQNPHFSIVLNKQYNVRAPAFGGEYYDDTVQSTTTLTGTLTNGSAVVTGLGSTGALAAGNPVIGVGIPANTQILSVDSGSQVTLTKNATTGSSQSLKFQKPWSWSALVTDLWTVLVSQLGPAPSPALPATANVDGVPEGWKFNGVPALDALKSVLFRLGCAFATNLNVSLAVGQLTIVKIGDADAVTAALVNNSQPVKIHDEDPQEAVLGRMPYGCQVLFHRQQLDYGTERTTPQTTGANGQFTTNEVYSVQVAGPASAQASALAGTYHPLWDDMPALYDAGGTLLNSSALATRAANRTADFFAMLQGSGGDRLRKVFSGLLPFAPGSTIKGVAFRQWHDGGLVTEIVRHPWYLLTAGEKGEWERRDVGSLALQALDLRPTVPVYPHLMQELRIANGTADSSKRFDAYVQATDPNALTVSDQERCWAVETTGLTTVTAGNVLGRLLGYNNGRPLYVFQEGGGGSSLDSQYDDATGDVNPTTLLQFLKADFTLTSLGGGGQKVATKGASGTYSFTYVCDYSCSAGTVTIKHQTVTVVVADGLVSSFSIGSCA